MTQIKRINTDKISGNQSDPRHQRSIPRHWSLVKLGDVVKFIRGVSFPKDAKSFSYAEGKVACLRTANVQKEVDWDNLWFIDERIVKRDEQYIQIGDILISSANSLVLLGKVSLIKNIPYKSTLGTFIVNIRVPTTQNNKFVYYYLTSREFIDEVKRNASTTTNISNISVGKLKQLKIRLAPLLEQKKIVEKIEVLFSDLEDGVASLKKAKEQIKLYRQSVLSSAFNGKLTAGHPELVSGSNGLPKDWKWVKLGEVIESIRYGTSKKCIIDNKGKPVLRIPNIINGFIDGKDLKFAEFNADEIRELSLKENDILIIRSNGSLSIVGKSAIVSKKHKGYLFAGYLIRIRLKLTSYNATFFNLLFSSNQLRNQIEFKAKSTSGVNNINSKEIQDLIIPLLPLNQQTQIVEEIERRFSETDNLEKAIDESLIKAEALRQSILKKAFEGKLIQ